MKILGEIIGCVNYSEAKDFTAPVEEDLKACAQSITRAIEEANIF